MSIHQIKPGQWIIDAHVRDGAKTRRKRIRFSGTKTQATEKWAELKSHLRGSGSKGSLTYHDYKTFGDCLTFFLENTEAQWAECRIKKLKQDLGFVDIGDLTEKFSRYINLVKTEPTRKGTKPVKATVNRLLQLAKAVTAKCHKYGLIDNDPLKMFSKLKGEKIRDNVISEDDFLRLFNILPEWLKPITLFAYQVPSRRGELEKLKKRDVDLFNSTVFLRAETVKTGKARVLPIPDNMMKYFENIPKDSEYVFFRDVRLGKNTVYRQLGDFHSTWNKVCKRAGITDFRFHDLRRIAATRLANKGVAESVIKRIGGWETDIFFKRYRHVGVNELKEAVNGFVSTECPQLSTKCG